MAYPANYFTTPDTYVAYPANSHISVCNPSACHGTERRKLVAAHGTGGGELYDLETDPTETHNQWNNPNYTTVRLDLMTRLADRMAWTVDPLPPREAGF